MKSQRLDSGRNRALRRAVFKTASQKLLGVLKKNHSDWNAQENSAPKSLNPMAPLRSRKKDEKDNLSTAMEL
jgi:hypothetical protein